MTATQRDLVVIAIGGNSLISARDKKSVADNLRNFKWPWMK